MWIRLLNCSFFHKFFLSIADKHAPVKKFTARIDKASWIDAELRQCMDYRDCLKREVCAEEKLITQSNGHPIAKRGRK